MSDSAGELRSFLVDLLERKGERALPEPCAQCKPHLDALHKQVDALLREAEFNRRLILDMQIKQAAQVEMQLKMAVQVPRPTQSLN